MTLIEQHEENATGEDKQQLINPTKTQHIDTNELLVVDEDDLDARSTHSRKPLLDGAAEEEEEGEKELLCVEVCGVMELSFFAAVF